MKKIMKRVLMAMACVSLVGAFAGCGAGGEKNITVIARETSSGTREAFDKKVTDGNGNYLQQKVNGETVFYTTKTATLFNSTGAVLSSVSSDKNAIGYVSLGSVNNSINVVKIEGVMPSAETVLDGSYEIQRPFVIMTKANLTLNERTQDFMDYLYSAEIKEHAEYAGCIFLEDETKRVNDGETAIPVSQYEKQNAMPGSGSIVIRGSTSMEKFIYAAAAGYADLYNADAEDVFSIELNGSSEGKKAVQGDTKGNVIGLSSAAVTDESIDSFNVCLDAVAVIVNKKNTDITDLTLAQLYDIYTGKVKKFSQLVESAE